jgi:hypothetical protein
MSGMTRQEGKSSSANATRNMTAAAIAKWVFAALFNTALVLGAAALAFYVAGINLIGHADSLAGCMLSVIAAFVAGVLMAWACSKRHSKPPSPPSEDK